MITNKQFFMRLFSMSLFVIFAFVLYAQAADPEPGTIPWLEDKQAHFFAALTTLWGIVSQFIPGVNKYSPLLTVLAFAGAAAVVFMNFGAEGINLLMSYILSNSFYDNVVKPIKEISKGNTSVVKKEFR